MKLASRVDQLPLEELKRAREFANKGPELDQLNVLIERKEALKVSFFEGMWKGYGILRRIRNHF